MAEPIRYRSGDDDSARWRGFPFRDGDIVISTRSKSGTTWMQMICALLVFGTPRLPEPLARISPWVDWLGEPREQLLAGLQAQEHRRILKTHTPLDGVPIDPRATYVVVARHPLDAAVSLYHHRFNLDRDRMHELIGPDAPPAPEPVGLPEWLATWIDTDDDPRAWPDSLPGVMWHLSDAWTRRDEPNVVLVRYEDLVADLEGGMRRLAGELGIAVPEPTWPALVDAATFTRMRERAADLAPDRGGIMKDRAAFFRRGGPGAGADELGTAGVERYHARAQQLAPPDLLAWLHA